MRRFAPRAILPILFLALVFSVAPPPLDAYDFTALQPQGYVSDFTSQKVIDAASRAELDRYCGAVEKSTGAQLSLITIDSLQGEPIEDVANAIFRKWGVGSKKSNEGALLLLVVGDRRMRLEVGYGLEPIMPDGFSGTVLRAMRPQLQVGHYGEALLDAVHTIGDRIATSKGVTIDAGGQGVRRRPASPVMSQIPWPLVIFGVFVLLMLLGSGRGGGGRRGRFGGGGGGGILPWLILNNMGRGGSGWSGGTSSGGFGGYDSGGGFGGFGGGDSGGGGASSSW
jgi:uncharacterized protein